MRPFLVVLLLALIVGAGVVAMFGWPSLVAPARPDPSPDLSAGPLRPTDPVRSEGEAAPVRAQSPEYGPAGADGRVDRDAAEVTLRIGDGYVFGEPGVHPRTERDEADVYCQDIRQGTASLQCRLGAAPALAPLTGIGLPETAVAAAALVSDAPKVFAARDLLLTMQATPEQPGVGFVRSKNGLTMKLCLIASADHPDALERSVRIRFARVVEVDGGGEIQLPKALGQPTAAARQAIRNAIAIGSCIPGQSMQSYLDGEFTAVEEPGPETFLRDARHVVVDGLSNQKVELASQGAVFVADRLARDASIVLRRGGAVGIGSDLEGTLRTDGYAFLFVGRDVTGTLDIRSYTTAVVLGDVRGTIRVRSYTDLYVRGRILGKLDLEDSGWCKFYFQSFLSRFDVEQLPGNSSITLHLMQSDLAPGKHTGIGKWREVIVGDPLWQKLAR